MAVLASYRATLVLIFVLHAFYFSPITCGCTSSPKITYVHRLSNAFTFLSWNPPTCYENRVSRYEIQFIDSCRSSAIRVNASQNRIMTSLINLSLCDTDECFVRIRGELNSQLLTSFSSCILINQITLLHYTTGFVYEYESICVPISTCNQRTSSFFINGIAISWSMASTHPYNITYDHATRIYNFCFSNVTENILFTEFCHGSPDSTECPLCSMSSGIFKFVSHVDISLQGRPSLSINKYIELSTDAMIVTPTSTFSTLFGMQTVSSVPSFTHQDVTIITGTTSTTLLPKVTPTIIPRFSNVWVIAILICAALIVFSCIGLMIVTATYINMKKKRSTAIERRSPQTDPIYEEIPVDNIDVKPKDAEVICLNQCPAYEISSISRKIIY